jgi:hypothetical protein
MDSMDDNDYYTQDENLLEETVANGLTYQYPSSSPHKPVQKGNYRYMTGFEDTEQYDAYDFAIVTRSINKQQQDSDKENVQLRIVEPLLEQGLLVDVIEAIDSTYFVLLIRAPDFVVARHAKKLKLQMWLKCGNARELDATLNENPVLNPADRIQVVDHLIREGLSVNVLCILSISRVTSSILLCRRQNHGKITTSPANLSRT